LGLCKEYLELGELFQVKGRAGQNPPFSSLQQWRVRRQEEQGQEEQEELRGEIGHLPDFKRRDWEGGSKQKKKNGKSSCSGRIRRNSRDQIESCHIGDTRKSGGATVGFLRLGG